MGFSRKPPNESPWECIWVPAGWQLETRWMAYRGQHKEAVKLFQETRADIEGTSCKRTHLRKFVPFDSPLG